PVPVEGVAERRVDLGARREPGLAAGAVGPLPESEDEDRPVPEAARDEPRRVLRLRAVEEEADLLPVDEFEALVGERVELLRIDPGVRGGREAGEVEADRVAGRSPRVESFVDDPVVIVPRRV